MDPYREEPFVCRVCATTWHHLPDTRRGWCEECREFTDTEHGYIAAVLHRVVGHAGVTVAHASKVLLSIKNTGNTLDSWRRLVEEAVGLR